MFTDMGGSAGARRRTGPAVGQRGRAARPDRALPSCSRARPASS